MQDEELEDEVALTMVHFVGEGECNAPKEIPMTH